MKTTRQRSTRCVLVAVCALFICPCYVAAEPQASSAARPFAIADNSFLVEEAFNQEKGVFQNIFGWTRSQGGGWQSTFTQEWPLLGMTHQFSYTLPSAGGDSAAHLGGVLLNYRVQALRESASRPAFSPRLSVILPTGRRVDASDRPGLQVNLPFSKQAGDVYVHWNAGLTWVQGVPLGVNDTTSLTTPHVAASVIWRMTPLFHVMLENVMEFEETAGEEPRVGHERILTVSPGFRRAWNTGDRQIVAGLALPISRGEQGVIVGALTYFSYELPFTDNR